MNDTHTTSVKVAQVGTDAKGTARAPFSAQPTHRDEETRENNGQDSVPSPAMSTKDNTVKIERLSRDQIKNLFQSSPSSFQHQSNNRTPSAVPLGIREMDIMAAIQECSALGKYQADQGFDLPG